MKTCSITCVIGWAAFWTFGALALTSDPAQTAQLMLASLLAVGGFMLGISSYLKISREVC